ncbi:MAG: acetyltransferase [SAR324 cluster bacterium]|nr:acetyltransferase [SAR324 cluster bacterium]
MPYDVFNGDADGICALHQLRLANPRDSELVTGVKRDIKLLGQLSGVRDSAITVLDISMDANKVNLLELLSQNNTIQYFDHHFAGEIPSILSLDAHIDLSPDVCTSILVDRYLRGKYRSWAVVAAFGDNLHPSARKLAAAIEMSPVQIAQLCELGELINYNSYGETLNDLHFSPVILYEALHSYEDPFEFYHSSQALAGLKEGYADDMEKANSCLPLRENSTGVIYRFPAESWGKRAAGVFCNLIARKEPDIAHALLVDNGDDSYLVSVRSPLSRMEGADLLCREFETGGGRKAAAGINRLPDKEITRFFERFDTIFSCSEHPN